MPAPADLSPIPTAEAPRDCDRCPRLVKLRHELRAGHPDWWNAPVPAFGDPDAWLAIVGLAPGKRGANRTGRAFTGDFAGQLLFDTLSRYGLARGNYGARRDDGLTLNGAIILNVVKCLPPGNRPLPVEADSCRLFLGASIDALDRLRTVIALGKFAHDSLCRVFGLVPARLAFAHGAEHDLPGGRLLIDSYHCSRQNVNTGRLTRNMFEEIFERALAA